MSRSFKTEGSSNILSIGPYDREKRQLQITFTNASYEYDNVEPEHVTELMFAPSIGSAFHKTLRNASRFPCRRLPAAPQEQA